MSLGFARDSVNDLSSLGKTVSKAKRLSPSSLGGLSLSTEEGDTTVVSLGIDNERGTRFDLKENKTKTIGPPETKPKPVSKKDASSYGKYAGFATDYADYEQYGGEYDNYSRSSLVLGQKNNSDGPWCCLFPWVTKTKEVTEGDSEDKVAPALALSHTESSKSDDEVSTSGSGIYGEKLTENERAAVLARLHLATPEMQELETPPTQKGLLNYDAGVEESKDDAVVEVEEVKTLKSILKQGTGIISASSASSLDKAKATQADGGGRRRSLFPQQYEQKPKDDKHIQFSSMARVVTIKSKNEMGDLEKSLVWWQRQDYDDFKKTGRMIAKAMCEGGSEIWLKSNNAWQNKANRSGLTTSSTRAIHLTDRSAIKPSEDARATGSTGDKWWHHFGHSRRGLEHIASADEGRQRQANVRIAIRVVIDEQRRQKVYRKEDPDKLRMLSLQYTSWARDLALAAAASDADAVKIDFKETRKSREFYILKQSRVQGGSTKKVPSFMMPIVVSPQVLDHHTSTQIQRRRKQTRVAPVVTSEEEAIHDANTLKKLAKKAAGFGTGGADVSAILSGLGSGDANSMPPMKPQMACV